MKDRHSISMAVLGSEFVESGKSDERKMMREKRRRILSVNEGTNLSRTRDWEPKLESEVSGLELTEKDRRPQKQGSGDVCCCSKR